MNSNPFTSSFGENLRIDIFGGSHEKEIGANVIGFPKNVSIDMDRIQAFMDRRAPGNNPWSTPRREPDRPIILSGMQDGITTGEPILAIIKNTNTRSSDYEKMKDVPRPGHADFTARMKFGDTVNMSGGGPFSGRMTAPMCIAGAICLQYLEQQGIFIGAHISSIEKIADLSFDKSGISPELLKSISKKEFPVLSESAEAKMKSAIEAASNEQDSVGGTIEACAIGLPIGLGGPLFEGVEGKLSQIIFAIPAVKGVEFGTGFASAALHGSDNNDDFYYDGAVIKTRTNNHGGILGGITSGMPLIVRAAFKPTPSIAKEQDSISFDLASDVKLSISGRHDPCVVLRAVPVMESALAIGILDILLGKQST